MLSLPTSGRIDYEEFALRFWCAENTRDEVDWSRSASLQRGPLFARSSWLKDDARAIGQESIAPMSALAQTQTEQNVTNAKQNSFNPLRTLPSWRPNLNNVNRRLESAAVLTAESTPLGDLRVSSVRLYPEELRQGVWPESYDLSDHGLLVAEFIGVALPQVPESERIDPVPYAAKRSEK